MYRRLEVHSRTIKKIGYPFDGRSLRLTVTDDLNDLIEPKSSA
jgi:hypothetical protein